MDTPNDLQDLEGDQWGHFSLFPIDFSSDEDLEALDLLFENYPQQGNEPDQVTEPEPEPVTEPEPKMATEPEPVTEPELATASKAKTSERAPQFQTVTLHEKENFVDSMKNKNTVKKTESAMKVFQRWLAEPPQLETRPINQLQATELDPLIGSFLLSIRKADGSEYEPDTLTSYHRSIDRYLRENKYPYSMVNDREFESSRSILAAKRKHLKQQGKGNRPNAADPITESETALLKEKGLLGIDSPDKLINLLWMNNTIMFGLRGGLENRNLMWGDIALKQTHNGREYIEFNERLTKTRTAEKKTETRSFAPKQFAHEDKQWCPVEAYKIYAQHRPSTMKNPDSPFYLAINKSRKQGSDNWFKAQPMGESLIRGLMKNMAEKGGLQGRKTNHSARKTTCTELLHKGVPPTTIKQLSGHKSLDSVNGYAIASLEQQEDMSDMLSHNPNPRAAPCQTVARPTSALSASSAPRILAQHNSNEYVSRSNQTCQLDQLFSNATFNNCTISINNGDRANRFDCSPVQKRRRILPLFDSDSD